MRSIYNNSSKNIKDCLARGKERIEMRKWIRGSSGLDKAEVIASKPRLLGIKYSMWGEQSLFTLFFRESAPNANIRPFPIKATGAVLVLSGPAACSILENSLFVDPSR